jgi:phosphatidate cytidylyltransferase
MYVAVPVSTTNYLAFPPSNQFEYTHRVLLGILILVWINDTGAYIIGITMGRHRLMERISPKKSWEGAAGGAVLTLLAAWWMPRLMGMEDRSDWIVISLIVSVFGVLGDLTESLFKRNAGLKDSGSIIPGHGGILDRIDSILFVMPLSLVYLLLSKLQIL